VPEEKEVCFYSDETGVRITNARAIIGSTTYSMANITSVSLAVIRPKRAGPVWLLVLGAIGGAVGFALSVWPVGAVGALMVVGAILILIFQKPRYAVEIGSASGRVSAVKSKKKEYIQCIVNAMNEAFIKRG